MKKRRREVIHLLVEEKIKEEVSERGWKMVDRLSICPTERDGGEGSGKDVVHFLVKVLAKTNMFERGGQEGKPLIEVHSK